MRLSGKQFLKMWNADYFVYAWTVGNFFIPLVFHNYFIGIFCPFGAIGGALYFHFTGEREPTKEDKIAELYSQQSKI